jgi:hypothetical protein
MKKIVKLVRLSSKEAFLKLRNLWEINCYAIWKKFKITNLFFRHISWNAVKRNLREIIERLSSINLIEKISCNWKLVETRYNIIVEKKNNFLKSYKIKYSFSDIDFFIVLWEKDNNEIILISVFINYIK